MIDWLKFAFYAFAVAIGVIVVTAVGKRQHQIEAAKLIRDAGEYMLAKLQDAKPSAEGASR